MFTTVNRLVVVHKTFALILCKLSLLYMQGATSYPKVAVTVYYYANSLHWEDLYTNALVHMGSQNNDHGYLGPIIAEGITSMLA